MMEKQRDQSKDEIRSNLPSPTLHAHRTSNFFIEDILRADFGCTRPSQTLPESNCSTDRGSSSACKRHSQADEAKKSSGETSSRKLVWPAWVYCTRYSDRPSSGPRTRKLKKKKNESEDKRPRTAFTAEQLQTLKNEFQKSPYITEQRRHILANELKLNESQIKIWFQNKRAKIKKSRVLKNDLALQLMEQGLYNHSTSKTP